MSNSRTTDAGRPLRAAALRDGAGLTDGQLLRLYLERRDGAAFSALVRRYGTMVWGVCRRLLGHHDAEDAFQAAFLVLARKAASVRPPEGLAGWLHGVALRAALQGRRIAARRQNREVPLGDADVSAPPPAAENELLPLLDAELARLPEKYRLPVVLCELQGRTRRDAARELGWPEGTVAGRLARGKARLARALTRHAAAPASLVPTLAAATDVNAVPRELLRATFALNESAPGGAVDTITQGVINAISGNLRKVFIAAELAVVLAGGVFAALRPGNRPADKPAPPAEELKDGREVMRRAAETCRAVRAIEYEAESGRIGDPPSAVAHIRQARADVPTGGMGPARYLIEVEDRSAPEPARRFTIAYDGKELRGVDHAGKSVRVVKSPDERAAGAMGPAIGAPMAGYGHFTAVTPFDMMLSGGKSFELKGTRDVLGTRCYEIRIEWERKDPAGAKESFTSTLLIGMKDFLPRGTESSSYGSAVRILRVNDPAISADFGFTTPKDYTESVTAANGPITRDLLAVGMPAPAWKLKDPNGKEHSLADYRGKVVVLDFWATWCAPCKKAMPAFQKLHEQFKDRAVAVFGVAINDPELDPAAYFKKTGFTYVLLLDDGAAEKAYQAKTLPTVYVIGKDGRVAHAEWGYREKAHEDLTKAIEKALAAND